MKRSMFALMVLFGLLTAPIAEAQRVEAEPTTEWGKEELRLRQESVARQVRSVAAGSLLCQSMYLPVDTARDLEPRPPLDPEVRSYMYQCMRSVYDAHCWTTPPVNDRELCQRLWKQVESWMTLDQLYQHHYGRPAPKIDRSEPKISSDGINEEYQVLFEALELLEQSELEALEEGLE